MTDKNIYQLSDEELLLKISELVSHLEQLNQEALDRGYPTPRDDYWYTDISFELEKCLGVADDRGILK